MSCGLGYSKFDFTLGVLVDYLIHGSGEWSSVIEFYSLRVSSKGPALVKFHVIKNK